MCVLLCKCRCAGCVNVRHVSDCAFWLSPHPANLNPVSWPLISCCDVWKRGYVYNWSIVFGHNFKCFRPYEWLESENILDLDAQCSIFISCTSIFIIAVMIETWCEQNTMSVADTTFSAAKEEVHIVIVFWLLLLTSRQWMSVGCFDGSEDWKTFQAATAFNSRVRCEISIEHEWRRDLKRCVRTQVFVYSDRW